MTHSAAAVSTPSFEAHPGQIISVDEDTEKTQSPADVPETIAWVKVGDMYEPVVRIETVRVDGRIHHILKKGRAQASRQRSG